MQKQVALISLRTVRARRRATAHHLKIFIDISCPSAQRAEVVRFADPSVPLVQKRLAERAASVKNNLDILFMS